MTPARLPEAPSWRQSRGSRALLIVASLLLGAATVLGGLFGARSAEGFGIQFVVSMAAGAALAFAAALAVLGFVGVFFAVVTSGFPADLDLAEEAPPSGRHAAVLVVLAIVLVLAGLVMLGSLPAISVLVSFLAIVLARIARSRAVPGTWQGTLATTTYCLGTVALVVALAGSLAVAGR